MVEKKLWSQKFGWIKSRRVFQCIRADLSASSPRITPCLSQIRSGYQFKGEHHREGQNSECDKHQQRPNDAEQDVSEPSRHEVCLLVEEKP
ncbi:MAG: hypothetical protein ACODAQ_10065 [Phycisphaeraceae bacterium]